MIQVKAETTKRFVSAMKSMPVQCIYGVLDFIDELLANLLSSDKANEELLKMIKDIKATAEKELETYGQV